MVILEVAAVGRLMNVGTWPTAVVERTHSRADGAVEGGGIA